MDKVIIRTKGLSQAVFSLANAGCDTAEVSVVANAVKVEGVIEGEVERLVLHIWSKEAEDTEAGVGKGEALTVDEIASLDKGKCPKCHQQLYKGAKEGLAIITSCDAGHRFWIPPLPLLPEYLGLEVEKEEAKEEVQEGIKEAVAELKEEKAGKAREEPDE